MRSPSWPGTPRSTPRASASSDRVSAGRPRSIASAIVRAVNESVQPAEQSIELFKRAAQPTELHLISDADHFMFGEGNTRVWELLRGWLDDYFPATAAVNKAAVGLHR